MARIRLTSTRRKIIFAVASLVVIAGAVAAWIILSPSSEKAPPPVATPVDIDSIQAEAGSYVNAGDLDGGLKFFDEQIEARDDPEDKQQILLHKSYFANNLDHPQIALEAAEQADAMNSNTATMVALAELHEQQGDNRKALEYYQKILDLSTENGGSVRLDGKWRRKIEELSS